MSLDIRELTRLHSAALKQKSCPAAYLEEANYLCQRVPEILSALRDKERLDKCERIAAKYPNLEADGLCPMTRAAIDALPGEEK